jgi:hypothetical protein
MLIDKRAKAADRGTLEVLVLARAEFLPHKRLEVESNQHYFLETSVLSATRHITFPPTRTRLDHP